MKPITWSKTIFATLLVVIACTGWWANHIFQVKKMSEYIQSRPTKTLCIGRLLLDVPSDTLVSYRSATVSGWDIDTIQGETDEEFDSRSKNKEVGLSAQKNEHGGVSLELIRAVSHGELAGKIFMYNRRWVAKTEFDKDVITEIVAIEALVRSRGISYDFKANFRRPPDIAQLEKILSQLRARPEEIIPHEPGFCFNQGFIAEPLRADQTEFVVVFMGLKDHLDLSLALSSAAGIKPGKSLLARSAASSVKKEHSFRFHVLREGPRSLGEVPGEEVLKRVSEPNGSMVHGFMWESAGTRDNVYLPRLTLELDTGHGRNGSPVQSSLSDEEALALWDKISASLRLRPGGGAKPAGCPNKES
jgi:hypothetical protein